jgi:CBS domain-containing protein
VVSDGHLVGIVTEHDFFNIAGLLLLEQLDPRLPEYVAVEDD